jgi:hypothetical protein
MRTSTKLKKLCDNRECGLIFKNREWRLFYPDNELGEAVFSGRTFSKAIGEAFVFMNKKGKKSRNSGK